MIFTSCLIFSLHSEATCHMQFTAFDFCHANLPRTTKVLSYSRFKIIQEIQPEKGQASIRYIYFMLPTQIQEIRH